MSMKKKLQPLSYAVTKTEVNYHLAVIDLMKKLVDQTRENNHLLRQLVRGQKDVSSPVRAKYSSESQSLKNNPMHLTPRQPTESDREEQEKFTLFQKFKSPKKEQEQENQESSLKIMMNVFQNEMKEMFTSNKQLLHKLIRSEQNRTTEKKEQASHQVEEDPMTNYINKLILEKSKKKKFNNYGIISQITPLSDKRQTKVRFSLHQLIEEGELTAKSKAKDLLPFITEWIGMVFRATASISWNMLSNGFLNFEEVKVLFTENIIFNYIELINDLQNYITDKQSFEITQHINTTACIVLEFLCRQYPQTKIEAPNMALKKAIPIIENQGQIKYDIVSMALQDSASKKISQQKISFQLRADKDYSSSVMKTINYMIDKTDQQFDQFQIIMTSIFQQIYLQKKDRNIEFVGKNFMGNTVSQKSPQKDNKKEPVINPQYKQKVKSYSSYAIGRKIPKNTPKYTDIQILYGVFFVKAPSILRIVTKWVEELYDFVVKSQDQEKNVFIELMNHEGKIIHMSSRVKQFLFKKIKESTPKIKEKIELIKKECQSMESVLSGKDFIRDDNQVYLSQDQLCVGKFCSNLKHAISSYVCSQLSKLIYYTSEVPKEIDEQLLGVDDQDFNEQARKHLDSVNLVSLKIFDLLRCKCHSNEEEIIWIVETLKELQKKDKKFEIVRVKDRLNQGTRDIMINAQYDGGLVWQIQLAVTSNVDKKQDLLDKYNHFLYQLKRAKLGPISECVSIWSSLEQKSIYFQQLSQKKKPKGDHKIIKHNTGFNCNQENIVLFLEFKRPLICSACGQYFSIPSTSLLNVRCESCKITYCGTCFYECLSPKDQKKFMFENFNQNKLLSKGAFDELEEYTTDSNADFKKPFPREGFFIKKKFLSRELSYFTVVEMKEIGNKGQKKICLAQTIIRGKKIICRKIHPKYFNATRTDKGYYNILNNHQNLTQFWIFHFPNKKLEFINLQVLRAQFLKPELHGIKYLEVLEEPNFMSSIELIKKSFEKAKFMNELMEVKELEEYQIGVHRFNNFTILASLVRKDQEQLKQNLIIKSNKQLLKKYWKKKMEVLHLQERDWTNQFQLVIESEPTFPDYLNKVSKLYLSDNHIKDISFVDNIKNLQLLILTKNNLTTLKGVQNLTKLVYIKFDNNKVKSLQYFSNLVNLQYISANDNEIDTLKGVENLKALKTLSLCSNKIQSIAELEHLQALDRVYLRSNPIEDIKHLKNLSLRHIFLGQTKIRPEIIGTFSYLKSVQDISLKKINLTNIPNIFTTMTNLTELKLSKNNINKIQHIDMLVNLRILDLNENKIQKIENLENLVHLQELKLKSNQIKIVSGVRSFMESLRRLYLQGNSLQDLNDYLIYEEETNQKMRLRYTQSMISEQAAKQIKTHSEEINNKSDLQD